MGRERRKNVRAWQREATRERTELEERFAHCLEEDEALTAQITAHGARHEPFHRWFSYRQGFAPTFVRSFLAEARPMSGPVLDPFAGSGTTAIECAREGRASCTLDSMPALARIIAARFGAEIPAWDPRPAQADWGGWWAAARHPAHQAAVLLAVARSVDGEGHRGAKAITPADGIASVLQMMQQDCASPLQTPSLVLRGDARSLPLADSSIGGALTSPPYLSRYDYARINEPMERLLGQQHKGALRRAQVRAARHVPAGASRAELSAAVREIEQQCDPQRARTVRSYFADLATVLEELARCLQDDAPCWINIAGTDHQRVYVPSDLILADLALQRGFRIERIRVARTLRRSGRSLGDLEGVAPRESVLHLRRARR